MRTALVAFVASALGSSLLTPAVRNLAQRRGAVDHALTSRKIHGRPIPRLGGIALVLAFYAPLAALLFVRSDVGARLWAEPLKVVALFGGGLAIASLGVYDDLRGADARTKFIVQFAVAGLMYWLGFRVDQISNPFGPPIHLGILGLPFTVLWIAGVINAMNLIDGLDGLAGGVGLVAVGTTFVIAGLHGDPLMLLFAAALAGALLGFLFYNFNPASIFMGDSGSMFLGFILATTAIQTNQKSSTAVALFVPVIALGVPIADTLLAMLRRAARGVPMFSGDRGHIHHRLLDRGLSHRQAVLVLYGVSIVLGLAAIALSYASESQAQYFLLVLAGAAYLALRRLGYIDLGSATRVLEERRRNLRMRTAIRGVADELRFATSLEDAWVALRGAAHALGACAITLYLPGPRALDDEPFSAGFDDPELHLRARYSLLVERPGDTAVELGWSDGRTNVDRDTEIAIEILCDHLSTALERLTGRSAAQGSGKVANLSG